MTDFASLLVADRGQPARPIHLVDKDSFARLAEEAPRRGPRAARGACGSTARRASLSSILPARRRLRGGRRGEECGGAFALVPRRARREAARGHLQARGGRARARPRSAGCSPSTASTPTARRRTSPSAARASSSPASRRRIDETVRLAEATALVRDLVNTPAADMGPAELEQAASRARQALRRAAHASPQATSSPRAIR